VFFEPLPSNGSIGHSINGEVQYFLQGKNGFLISFRRPLAGVTLTYLRSRVTGCNGAILNEVGRTAAVSLAGAHHGPEGVSGHCFGTPPCGPAGQRQSRGLIQYD
jgi:hypothetical protein